MGWTVTPDTTRREAWDRHFAKPWRDEKGQEVTVGEPAGLGPRWWAVVSLDGKPSCVLLALMEGPADPWGRGEVAVKVMTEHCGPFHYDCPLRMLKETPEPKPGSFAAGWREKVRRQRRNA